MSRALRRSLLPALLAALSGACAAPQTDQALGPVDFLIGHYENLRPGADWEAVRRDFTADAVIARNDQEHSGNLLLETADTFFLDMGPAIDARASFLIEPMGMDVMVYDRIASGWVYVRVRSESDDGTTSEFEAVDLLTLFLNESEEWQITHLLYQHRAEDWPPSNAQRMGAFTAGGTRTDVQLGMIYN